MEKTPWPLSKRKNFLVLGDPNNPKSSTPKDGPDGPVILETSRKSFTKDVEFVAETLLRACIELVAFEVEHDGLGKVPNLSGLGAIVKSMNKVFFCPRGATVARYVKPWINFGPP